MPARSLRVYAPMSRFSRTVMRGKSRLSLGRVTHAEPSDSRLPDPRVFAEQLHLAAPGPMRPLMVRSVVVLPAPLLPMSATISPLRTSSQTLLSALTRP